MNPDDRLSPEVRDELLAAWTVWDDLASKSAAARRGPTWLAAESARLVDADHAAADELGWDSGHQLRGWLAARRRDGCSYSDCLDQLNELGQDDRFPDTSNPWR